jgi:hypothetical protein
MSVPLTRSCAKRAIFVVEVIQRSLVLSVVLPTPPSVLLTAFPLPTVPSPLWGGGERRRQDDEETCLHLRPPDDESRMAPLGRKFDAVHARSRRTEGRKGGALVSA